jgi:hypothetical protein
MKENFTLVRDDNMKGMEVGAEFVAKTIAQFLGGEQPGIFSPCAYYDKHLDCIRVQLEDCSFTEIRLNKLFTIYKVNHTETDKYIGFSIKGVRHVLEKEKFPLAKKGPYILADILDAIVKAQPEFFSDIIQRQFAKNLNLVVQDLEYDKVA